MLRNFGRALIAGLVIAAGAGIGHAATFPYTNDFSGSGANVDLPTEAVSGTGSWSVGSGVYTVTSSNPNVNGANNVNRATVDITGVPGDSLGENFALSTRFQVTNKGSATNLSVGFAAFSDSGVATYYLADVETIAGGLRILSLGTANTDFTTATGSAGALTVGTWYRLLLTGTHDGTKLNLNLQLRSDAGTAIGTASVAADPTPLAGNHFGYRNNNIRASGGSPGSTTVLFDDLSLQAVPEPAGLMALAAVGMLGLARRRRRRR